MARRPPPASSGRRRRFGRVQLAAEIVLAYVEARRALACSPLVVVLARLRGQSRPHAWLPAVAPVEGGLSEAVRLGRAVSRVLAVIPGDTRCLMRALVLIRLLARRGIPARLVIGARPTPRFLAHAWVEAAGQPVLAAGDGAFGRLVEL